MMSRVRMPGLGQRIQRASPIVDGWTREEGVLCRSQLDRMGAGISASGQGRRWQEWGQRRAVPMPGSMEGLGQEGCCAAPRWTG